MKEIIERIKAETPGFFKRLRKIALAIGVSAVAAWTINETMHLEINEVVVSILKYIIVACAAIAGTATLTRK